MIKVINVTFEKTKEITNRSKTFSKKFLRKKAIKRVYETIAYQQKKPSDFVVGTGKMHSVRDFAKLAFSMVGLNYKKYIKLNKKLLRPAEVDTLQANYKKANKILGWKPEIQFKQLVREMVQADLKFFK